MRQLSDLSRRQFQKEDVPLTPVTIGLERDLGTVGRGRRLRVVVRSEGELLGVTAFHRQAEEVPEQREDQRFAIGCDRDIGGGDLGGLDVDGTPAVVLGGSSIR